MPDLKTIEPSVVKDILNPFFYPKLDQTKPDKKPQAKIIAAHLEPLEDDDIISILSHEKDTSKFDALWRGSTADYNNDDNRADMALACKIAFYARRDAAQIERIMRQSGLLRKKWDRVDYMQNTIRKAIDGCDDDFDPDYNTRGVDISGIQEEKKNPPSSADTQITPLPAPLRKLECDLEPDNFISKWMAYGARRTDSYPEYFHLGAVTLLSIAADRKLVVPLNFGDVFSNVWVLGLGLSSVSRKSTAMKFTSVMASANYPEGELPSEFSSEAMIERLSINPHSYQILDEAGATLKALNHRTYLQGLKDILCKLYDGLSQRRTLRTSQRKDQVTDFRVDNPYLVFSWCTTYDSFESSTSENDIKGGLLARFLIYAPRYAKEVKEASMKTEDMRSELSELGERYRRIRSSIKSMNGVIELQPSEKGFKEFNNWDKEVQGKISASGIDTSVSIIHARMATMVFKLSSLYYLGSEQFLQDISTSKPEPEPKNRGNLEPIYIPVTLMQIPDRYFLEALKNVQDYFSPVSAEIVTDLGEKSSENVQTQIVRYVRESGNRVKRNDVLKKIRIKSKDFADHVNALLESGSLKEEIIPDEVEPDNKNKITKYLVLVC